MARYLISNRNEKFRHKTYLYFGRPNFVFPSYSKLPCRSNTWKHGLVYEFGFQTSCTFPSHQWYCQEGHQLPAWLLDCKYHQGKSYFLSSESNNMINMMRKLIQRIPIIYLLSIAVSDRQMVEMECVAAFCTSNRLLDVDGLLNRFLYIE